MDKVALRMAAHDTWYVLSGFGKAIGMILGIVIAFGWPFLVTNAVLPTPWTSDHALMAAGFVAFVWVLQAIAVMFYFFYRRNRVT